MSSKGTAYYAQREDAEEFGEFFHEGKASAPPEVRSFEEDALLKRPPPDYEQSQEHWLDLHDGTREKLWRLYRMDNPSTLEDDEESVKMEEAMARARKERSDKKARQDLEREHAVKRVDLQTQLDEAARQLWGDERTRQGAEERIADAEAQIKELKAEAAAASSNQRETYDQYQKLRQEWRAEERKSRQRFSGTSHQDLVLEPFRLPYLPPSVRLFEKRAEPQRSAAPPLDNAEAARPVPAWVGSPSCRPTLEARRTPPTRGVLAKFVDHSRALGRWKFLSIRELEEERLEPPAQRAIAELDRTLANDLSWTTNFPGLVDIRAATLREVWDKMDSFSQELHQAVWDVLQNLVRATTRRAQEDRTDGKRQHDRSPPRKFSSRGENDGYHQINENMALVDLEDRSCSDRASVIDPPQELRTNRPTSATPDEKLDRQMEMKYRQLPTKNFWKIRPALPLPEDDEGREFVEFMMSLDQTLQDILSLDPRSTSQALSWAPGWQVPLRKCLWDSVNPRSSRSSSLNAMLNSCMEQVEVAMDTGSSGEQAYRLLESELRRELDTRECGAALQKLIAFRVGEGVPFSDCYRSFRSVVHDAKSDGQFSANFNIVQSIVSVLMSQQYPTLYEITFPRNAPNRYFVDEAQMWKALDLLKRNVTRSLPSRSDTGARGSSGGGAPGVGVSSAKIASKPSSAWIPESIMNMKYIFKADFPSWPASLETWGVVYSIRNDNDPPLLARFSDPKTKSATFRKFVGQCLNCLSEDGHNMRSFLNKSGLLNRKIGELPEPEKDAVWRRIQNRLKRSQYRQKSSGNSQKKRNTDRSEVAVRNSSRLLMMQVNPAQTDNPMMGYTLRFHQ